MSRNTRSVHRLVRSGLAVVIGTSLLAAPVEASAITRPEVMRRAHTWHAKRITYSQSRFFGGYRTDCSGYVSMAWGLNRSLTTWSIPSVAHRIGKSDLKPGDVLLNNNGGVTRHVVIFAEWANKARTKYIGYEENGPVGRAVRRVIPYPFFFAKSAFKPWRFDGITDGPAIRAAVTPAQSKPKKVQTKGYVDTIKGADRYVTAVAASRASFKKAGTVVIASGENWADAIVASSLAGASSGPLLLVRSNVAHAEVLSEIGRLGAHEILVVGSEQSVGKPVIAALQRVGHVRRFAAPDRYSMAALVARETVRRLDADPAKDYDGTVLVTNGDRPLDALAVTPVAANKAWPILFSRSGYLAPEARGAILAIGITRGILVGGGWSAGSKVGSQLQAVVSGPVERVKGVDRYSTSAAAADFSVRNGLKMANPAVVTNATSVDAVAAGVAQGANGSVILITRRDMLSDPVSRTIGANREAMGRVRVIGTTMATPVKESLARRMGAPSK